MTEALAIYLSLGAGLWLLTHGSLRVAYERAVQRHGRVYLARTSVLLFTFALIALWPLFCALIAVEMVKYVRRRGAA